MGGGTNRESVDTVEGAIQHRRVDAKATALPDAADLAAIDPLAERTTIERPRVIAKMDVVEVEGGVVTPGLRAQPVIRGGRGGMVAPPMLSDTIRNAVSKLGG